MRNIPIVISGPSGVGKGTIVKELLKKDPSLVESVSMTTRDPRPGEVSGKTYIYVSREEFERRIAEGDFLEYDEHFSGLYGTPRSFVEDQLQRTSVILEIDVVGGLNARKLLKDTILIFIDPPSIEELVERLKKRGTESEQALRERLQRVKYEVHMREQYDYKVLNDDLGRAVDEVLAIIEKERNKEGE